MAIPEPEYKLDVYQLENILEALGYDWKNHNETRAEYIHNLRSLLNEHLDTV